MIKLRFHANIPNYNTTKEVAIDVLSELIASNDFDSYGFEQIELDTDDATAIINGLALVSNDLAGEMASSDDGVLTLSNDLASISFNKEDQFIGDADILKIAEAQVARMDLETLKNYVVEDLILLMNEGRNQCAENFWREFDYENERGEMTLNTENQ